MLGEYEKRWSKTEQMEERLLQGSGETDCNHRQALLTFNPFPANHDNGRF